MKLTWAHCTHKHVRFARITVSILNRQQKHLLAIAHGIGLYLCRQKDRDKNCENFTSSVGECFDSHMHCPFMVLQVQSQRYDNIPFVFYICILSLFHNTVV